MSSDGGISVGTWVDVVGGISVATSDRLADDVSGDDERKEGRANDHLAWFNDSRLNTIASQRKILAESSLYRPHWSRLVRQKGYIGGERIDMSQGFLVAIHYR